MPGNDLDARRRDTKIIREEFYDCGIRSATHRRLFYGNRVVRVIKFFYPILPRARLCFDKNSHLQFQYIAGKANG